VGQENPRDTCLTCIVAEHVLDMQFNAAHLCGDTPAAVHAVAGTTLAGFLVWGGVRGYPADVGCQVPVPAS
jgi:hypothetical protein